MLKITGLDGLQKELEKLSQALQSLDGQLANVRFDPSDPASIESAIKEIEKAIDAKAAPYSDNPMVASVVEQLKETYRRGILERAAAARLSGDGAA